MVCVYSRKRGAEESHSVSTAGTEEEEKKESEEERQTEAENIETEQELGR